MVEYKKIENCEDILLEKVEPTYLFSFPECERRDFASLKKLISPDSLFTLYVLLYEEKYVGFLTAWCFDDFYYVEHFAIDESARNGGIGGKALRQFLSTCELPVILEVERPEDEMSIRRIHFYERLGFKLDNHPYKQPPYRAGGEWLDLYLMTYGDIDMNLHYEEIKNSLHKQVYGV